VKEFPANLSPLGSGSATGGEDDMTNDGLVRLIQEQFAALRKEVTDDIRDLKSDLKEDVKDLKDDVKNVKEDVESIKRDLGGQGGIRERVTAIEVKVQKAVVNTTASPFSSPPPSSQPAPKPRKPSIKDHGMALGAGAGGAGAIIAIVELIQTVLKSK
jgi:3-deoxy-D-manno-octulosonate 8-phosphate phosphatase KdsC-like HAD superfamily phosphatase